MYSTSPRPLSQLYLVPKPCYNDIVASDLEVQIMKFKIKEKEVLRIHKNTITPPSGNYHAWKTRVRGAKNNQIVKKNYEDLIEALYNHYFGCLRKTLTLEECILTWINIREEKGIITYLSAVHYRADYKKYVQGTDFANTDITLITKAKYLRFLEELVGDGSKMLKSTLNNIKTVINCGFQYANMLDGYDCIDPSKIKINYITAKCCTPDNEDEVYEKEDAITLMKYLEGLDQTVYTLAIRLCFCLSVRIGEIRAVRWSKYDKENRLLRLDHSMVTEKTEFANRTTVCKDYMKKHSESGKRTLPISDYAALVLEELEQINGDKEFILQSAGDLPISTNNFNEHLRKYCHAAGIEYHSSHKIRFFACSNMYDNGLDEKLNQYFMGHQYITTTRHYDRRKHKKLEQETVNKTFGFELPAPKAEA